MQKYRYWLVDIQLWQQLLHTLYNQEVINSNPARRWTFFSSPSIQVPHGGATLLIFPNKYVWFGFGQNKLAQAEQKKSIFL